MSNPTPSYPAPPAPRAVPSSVNSFAGMFLILFGAVWGIPAAITAVVFVLVDVRLFGLFTIIPVAVALITVPMLMYGFVLRSRARVVYRDGKLAVGRVITMRFGSGRGAHRTYRFYYGFHTERGVETQGEWRTKHPPSPGDLVWVAYLPDRPDKSVPIIGWPEAPDPYAIIGVTGAVAAAAAGRLAPPHIQR